MAANGEEKTCFVISPIGSEGSDARKRADDVFDFVIEPAAKACELRCVRADKIDESGTITNQVISNIVSAKIVVADFWGLNPNVFYELAVRHVLKLPVIHLYLEEIPFDVHPMRAIKLDHRDARSWEDAKGKVLRQMQTALKPDFVQETPISISLDVESLKASDSNLEKRVGEIHEMVSTMRSEQEPDGDPVLEVLGVRRMPAVSSLSALVALVEGAPPDTKFLPLVGDPTWVTAVRGGTFVPFRVTGIDLDTVGAASFPRRSGQLLEIMQSAR